MRYSSSDGSGTATRETRRGWFCSRASTRRVRLGILVALIGVTWSAGPRRGLAEPAVVREARIESARGMALGSGARAGSASTQAQAENPANLPLGHLAHVETLYQYQPQLKSMAAGAAVVDGMTSGYFAAGMSARWLFSGKSSGWEGRLGLGVPIGEMLSLGMAARFSNITVVDNKARAENYAAPPPADGEDPVPEDHRYKLKAFTLDSSITLRPFDGFSISALGYNLINTHSPLAPLMVGGSVAFGRETFSLGADVLADLNQHKEFSGVKLQVGGGFEYLTQGVAPIRVGYLWDQGRHQHAISGGIGYLNKQFSVQLSMRQYVAGSKDTTLFSAVQYFVQ
jgi:hypothetical protein